MFDNVKGSGHVGCFLATRDMQLGDIVILHVGKQDPAHESGVYAYGTVIYGPYILENRPAEYCNNKLTVDVRIDHIVYDTPIITHEQCKADASKMAINTLSQRCSFVLGNPA